LPRTGLRNCLCNFDEAIGVRAELGPHRHTGHTTGIDDRGTCCCIVGDDAAATFQIWTRQVDFACNDALAHAGKLLGRLGVVAHTSTPDARHHRGSCTLERRKIVSDPAVHTGTLKAHSIDHPRRQRVDPWRRIPGPRFFVQRLHHHATEFAQVHVLLELVGMPCRTRGSQHRLSQRDRTNLDTTCND